MGYQFQTQQIRPAYAVSEARASLLRSVFAWMSLGLAVTWLVSLLVLHNASLAVALLRPGMLLILFLVEIGLVVWLSARVHHMSAGTAAAVFLSYSALNGVTLTPLALIYTEQSIASVFLCTAGAFAGMAFFGYATKRDLSGVGSFVTMGLWGMIIAGVVNLFFRSDLVSFVISAAGVVVFTGLSAWHVQRIKDMGTVVQQGTVAFRQQAITGALALYLDFINLFISLLRLMGDRR